jgi:hypothetical protein
VCVCVCVCEDDCTLGTDSDYIMHLYEDDRIIRIDSDYTLCVCACVHIRYS